MANYEISMDTQNNRHANMQAHVRTHTYTYVLCKVYAYVHL
jgi:hypothetical protein